jgi:hypothetical protein
MSYSSPLTKPNNNKKRIYIQSAQILRFPYNFFCIGKNFPSNTHNVVFAVYSSLFCHVPVLQFTKLTVCSAANNYKNKLTPSHLQGSKKKTKQCLKREHSRIQDVFNHKTLQKVFVVWYETRPISKELSHIRVCLCA